MEEEKAENEELAQQKAKLERAQQFAQKRKNRAGSINSQSPTKKAQAKDAAAAAAATAASGTTGSTAGHCDRGGARAVKKAAVGVSHIYDLACGHGLLGILLAYRFPRCEVRSLPRAHLLSHTHARAAADGTHWWSY